MLLQELVEYQRNRRDDLNDNEEPPPPEYESRNIPWLIRLDSSGDNTSFVRTSSGNEKRDLGQRYMGPALKRSGTNIKPQLLADTAEIALGINPEEPQRALSRHADFVVLVEACADATQESSVRAVVHWLKDQLPDQRDGLTAKIKSREHIQFAVADELVVGLEAVQEFWAKVAPIIGGKGIPRELTKELILGWLDKEVSPTAMGQCLVCGEIQPIARVHPLDIRVPRQVSDQQFKIVSANKEAFYSYGLEQSFHAPTCRECARDYARAANRLINSDRNRAIVADSVFFWWLKHEESFDATILFQPSVDAVKALFETVERGGSSSLVNHEKFYGCTITGSRGRAAIRSWINTTVDSVNQNAHNWFSRQSIVREWGAWPLWKSSPPEPYRAATSAGQPAEPIGIRNLAVTLIPSRNGQPDWNRLPRFIAPLIIASAFLGDPLPNMLLPAAIRRSQVERSVPYRRAVLIKLALSFTALYDPKEDPLTSLDQNRLEPAYHCGRLFAILEQIQRSALGERNTTITDRYFSNAVVAPASVLPYVMRLSKHHLSRLRRENKGGLVHLYDEALSSVMEKLMSFPLQLKVIDQGLFLLGYYHQLANDRARAMEAAAKRKAGQAA